MRFASIQRLPIALTACLTMNAAAAERDYAESVMVHGFGPGGSPEIALRLARFPGKNEAHIWLHLAVNGQVYSLVDEGVALGQATGVTAIEENSVIFEGVGSSTARFESGHRHSTHMKGTLTAELRANATAHPETGVGDIPIKVRLEFTANDTGARVNGGRRWELFGRMQASVELPSGEVIIAGPGKWHEQIGPRARFAPKFTYFNVQGEGVGLLAIGYDGRVAGYAVRSGTVVAVRSFNMEPPGPAERHFRLELADHEVISGTARVVQAWSVPIEGQRRPGATVRCESNWGELLGTLNDWNPR